MILAFAALALAQANAPQSGDDEIVVIGRRFEQASVNVGKDARGRFTCSLTASSGNARLDERLCRAASKCVIKGATDQAGVKDCIDRKKPELLAHFRREWQRGTR